MTTWTNAEYGISMSPTRSTTNSPCVVGDVQYARLQFVYSDDPILLTLRLAVPTSKLKASLRRKIDRQWKRFSEDIQKLILDSSSKETTG